MVILQATDRPRDGGLVFRVFVCVGFPSLLSFPLPVSLRDNSRHEYEPIHTSQQKEPRIIIIAQAHHHQNQQYHLTR